MKLSQFRFNLPEELVALEPPHKTFENEDGTVEKIVKNYPEIADYITLGK